MYTQDNVIQAIKISFPNSKINEVLNLLDLYGQGAHEYEKERVHLAIIKISRGNVSELKKYVNLAKVDYRDILMSAEYNKAGVEIKDPYRELGI